jgi:hypothetical protein
LFGNDPGHLFRNLFVIGRFAISEFMRVIFTKFSLRKFSP